ncbi:MAG: GNAT family N-acetyltransferase [Clostridiales bacterium]|nr:GNAT family N-acetyltransferase [Clostridiales bacterium]
MSEIKIEIEKPNKENMLSYSKLSIDFFVESEYRLMKTNSGLGGLLIDEVLVTPYHKTYDREDDNPSHLMEKFDLSNWFVISAYEGENLVGGALLAYNTKEINMLEGREDLTVLWDIRIDKDYRNKGIGHQLVNTCKKVSKELNCNRLKIETQNINVSACKFYVRQGAELTSFKEHCYEEYPNEIQFIWSIYLG